MTDLLRRAARVLPALAGGGLLVLVASGCGLFSPETSQRFLVLVDSVEVVGEVAVGRPVSLRLLGMVGPDRSYSLDRIEVEQSEGQATVKPWGERQLGGGGGLAVVPLDETITLEPLGRLPFRVQIWQPGAPNLVVTLSATVGAAPVRGPGAQAAAAPQSSGAGLATATASISTSWRSS